MLLPKINSNWQVWQSMAKQAEKVYLNMQGAGHPARLWLSSYQLVWSLCHGVSPGNPPVSAASGGPALSVHTAEMVGKRANERKKMETHSITHWGL